MIDRDAPRLLYRRSGPTLVPASQQAADALKEVRQDERVWLTIDRERSPRQERLLHALITLVAEATYFETHDKLLGWLKVQTGRCDYLKLPDGSIERYPHSIKSMNRAGLSLFFDECVKIICEEILPGTNDRKLVEQVDAMLGPDQDAAP